MHNVKGDVGAGVRQNAGLGIGLGLGVGLHPGGVTEYKILEG